MAGRKEPIMVFVQEGPVTVGTIRTSSVLSSINVADFGNEVLAHMKDKPKINLLLNFEHVEYLSSAVLTELLRINKAVQELEGRLHLCAISTVIREIFEITNLDKIFVLFDDGVDAGVRRLKRSIEIASQESAWREPSDH